VIATTFRRGRAADRNLKSREEGAEAMSVVPKPIEFWRSAKQTETLARFPFLQESRWRRWFGRGRPRAASEPALRIHHALTPFRQMDEVDGASRVIAAAARRDPRIDPAAIERLLVDLRYCPDAERSRAYEYPDVWLDAREGRPPRPAPRPLGMVRVG
jgi:hypothetical protein